MLKKHGKVAASSHFPLLLSILVLSIYFFKMSFKMTKAMLRMIAAKHLHSSRHEKGKSREKMTNEREFRRKKKGKLRIQNKCHYK